MIKTVFFDLDDTLFDFKRSERAALTKTLTELNIEVCESTLALYSRINRQQWESLERGETTREVLLVKRYEILFGELGVCRDPRAAQALYEKALSNSYFYIDGAEEVLRLLRGKYKMYLASNGTAVVQNGRIALSGIDRYFDGIFISEKIGFNKPSREFFEGCFSKIEGFDKECAIIIGDSLSSDILGGIHAGIKTCLYAPFGNTGRGDIKPDYEVRSLREIPELLKNIN